MDRRLTKVPGARALTRGRSDAFSDPGLDAYLREKEVGRVLVAGLDAAWCVNAAACGALDRGDAVTIFLDGLATESAKSLEEISGRLPAAGADVRNGTEP